MSEQRFLVLGEQPVVDGEKVHAVQQPVNDDRVAPDLGIELGEAAQAQKLLRLLERGAQSKAQAHEAQSTEHAVSAVDGSKPITHRRGSGE